MSTQAIHTDVYVRIYTHVYAHVCIYIHICMYIYMYIHVPVCIYEMQRDRAYLREPSIRLVVCIVGTCDSTRAGYLDGFRYSGNMYMNTYSYVHHKYVYIYIYICIRMYTSCKCVHRYVLIVDTCD